MAERKRRTYRIGQAAEMLNLEGYVLRFWETEFPQLQPLRTPKGQRIYSDADIELLRRIRALVHEEGMTLEGARRRLASELDEEMSLPAQPESGSSTETGDIPHTTAASPEEASSEKSSGVTELSERRAVRDLLAGMEQELLALREKLRQGLPSSVNRDGIL